MKSKLLFAFTLVAGLPLVTLAGGGEGFTSLVGIPGLPTGKIMQYGNILL